MLIYLIFRTAIHAASKAARRQLSIHAADDYRRRI